MLSVMDVLGECDLVQLDDLLDFMTEYALLDEGIMYLKIGDRFFEEGSPRYNPEMAFKFYTLSGNDGVAEALRKAGHMRETGVGTDQSYQRAAECYQSAADLGDPVAVRDLASLKVRIPVH